MFQISSPSWLLIFSISNLIYKEFLKFHVAKLISHSFIICSFCNLFKKIFPYHKMKKKNILLLFLVKGKNCWFFTFIFFYLPRINFEYGVRQESLLFFHMGSRLSWLRILNNLTFIMYAVTLACLKIGMQEICLFSSTRLSPVIVLLIPCASDSQALGHLRITRGACRECRVLGPTSDH